jgi:hypothetical protein
MHANTFSLPVDALSALDAIKPTLRRDPRLVREVKSQRRAIRFAAFDKTVRAGRSGRNKWRPKVI